MSPSPTPSPKPLSFLAPPPIRSKSASRIVHQIPKRNAITQAPTLKASKKSNSKTPLTKNKRKPLKKTIQNNPSNPPTRKHPHPNSHPNPTKIPSNPPQKLYPPKRKYVFPQTQVHFTPNAKAFHLKRKDVFHPKISRKFSIRTRKTPKNLPK